MASHRFEKQELCRRTRERTVSELVQYAQQSQRLCQAAQNEAKAASVQQRKMVERMAAETEAKEHEKNELGEHMRLTEQKKQIDSLAQELSQQNKEDKRMQQEIQRILESSDELKQLESKLKIAYINKERAAQHQESVLLKSIELAGEKALEEEMERERQSKFFQEEQKAEKRRANLIRQKSVLQSQMDERLESLLKYKADQLLKEKEIIDGIILQINKEESLELEKRRRKRDQTRALIIEFQEQQARSRAIARQNEIQEEEQIKDYNERVEQRVLEQEARKKDEEEKRKMIWVKVVEETNNQTRSRIEYEELRGLLWQEELEAKQAKEEKDRLIHRLALKEETMRLNKEQIAAKAQIMVKFEEEERQLLKLMNERFAADDEEEKKKHQLMAKKKEMFLTKIRDDQEEKRRLFELERQKILSSKESAAEQDQFRRFVIAEARKRLLRQHIEQLQGFLPRGTILSQEEDSVRRVIHNSN